MCITRGGSRPRAAAARFDRRIKDLKAAGELHLLDEEPRGTITLRDYVYEVWWPDYAEVNLTDEGRANYGVQLDLRIIPDWGDHPLRHLRPGPIEAWVSTLRKQGVGDPTILKTLTVFRSILKRAERDEEIARNPIPLVAKPKQARIREPRPVAPYYVELIRRHMLDPIRRQDKRGYRHARRPELDRHRDATLVSVLAYSGPRPESEALPLQWWQMGSAPSPTAPRRRPHKVAPDTAARATRRRPGRVPHPLRAPRRRRPRVRRVVRRRLGQLARADLPTDGDRRRTARRHDSTRPARQHREPAHLRGPERARGRARAWPQAKHVPGHLRAPIRRV